MGLKIRLPKILVSALSMHDQAVLESLRFKERFYGYGHHGKSGNETYFCNIRIPEVALKALLFQSNP
jgi:hypothetical protein